MTARSSATILHLPLDPYIFWPQHPPNLLSTSVSAFEILGNLAAAAFLHVYQRG
ncbi:MAG: hypothetical protein HYZ81_07585 [Nitrospinae bacterium]|nr:hypothetical protein [Nitrospinota bacterium]